MAGRELAYDLLGSGPPLMVIHGTGSTPAGSFGPALQRLASSFTVIAPYLPGSGASPISDAAITQESLARQLLDVADQAGHDRFAVAGVSVGGPIALALAGRHPDRVTHVISLDGYRKPRPSLTLRFDLMESLLDGDPLTLGRLLLTFAMPGPVCDAMPPGQLDQFAKQLGAGLEPGVARQLAFARSLDVTREAERVVAPALVMCGLADNFVHPEHSRDIADAVPHARLIELGGAGHGVASARTDEVVSAVTAFILS